MEGVKLDIGVSKGENSIKENSQDFCKTEHLNIRIFLTFLRDRQYGRKVMFYLCSKILSQLPYVRPGTKCFLYCLCEI